MEGKIESGPVGITKVKDLTPQLKNVNVLVKVTGVGEPKEIPSRFGGETKKVAEARVGDETGIYQMLAWRLMSVLQFRPRPGGRFGGGYSRRGR